MRADEVFQALRELPQETLQAFIRYHKGNPGVWRAFERFALQAAARKRHFGAKAIMERVRYEAEIERGEEFDCNNNYTSYYARIFAHKYRQYSDLFEFRAVKGLREAA